MAVSWPASKKTFTQIVDGVTYMEAVNINTVYDEVEALETYLGASGNAQSKNAALNNLFKDMFFTLPQLTWIDADTIEIEAKAVVMYDGNDYVIKKVSSAVQIALSADLDTGSEANSTWYDVYLIGDGSSTTWTAQFVVAGNTPNGATYYKKIGSVRNDGSGDILKFYQKGDWILWDIMHNVLASGTQTTFTDVDCSAFIPPLSTLGKFYIHADSSSGTASGNVRPNGSAAAAGATGAALYFAYASKGVTHAEIGTDTSQIIEYLITDGDNAENMDIEVLGFYLGGLL